MSCGTASTNKITAGPSSTIRLHVLAWRDAAQNGCVVTAKDSTGATMFSIDLTSSTRGCSTGRSSGPFDIELTSATVQALTQVGCISDSPRYDSLWRATLSGGGTIYITIVIENESL